MGLKTQETKKSVKKLIDSIANESKKKDCKVLLALIKKITGKEPKIWGDNFCLEFCFKKNLKFTS